MSILNFANVRYAGGAVPQGSSNFYSGITLFNSRPDDHQHDIIARPAAPAAPKRRSAPTWTRSARTTPPAAR